MFRRIFHILLPIYAFVFCINCTADNALVEKHDFCLSKNSQKIGQNCFPNNFDNEKADHFRPKNVIRTKAWDKTFNLHLATIISLQFINHFSPKSICFTCSTNLHSHCSSQNSQRGPPISIS